MKLLIAFMLSASALSASTVTAYCSCHRCCGWWGGNKTASGNKPKQGITVAGPRSLPLGTRVFIEGIGERVVQDRLSKKHDSRFDLFFSSHSEAAKFGKKELKVTVLKKGKL